MAPNRWSPTSPPDVVPAVQDEQLGTGHATRVGLDALEDVAPEDTIMVLYGDMPLLTNDLLARLADRSDDVAARMVTSVFEDPTGYGRVITRRRRTGGRGRRGA